VQPPLRGARGKFVALDERGHAILRGPAVALDDALGVATAGAQLALQPRAGLLDVALQLVARGGAAALEATDVLADLALGGRARAEAVDEVAGQADDGSRASRVAPTYTSAARSATLRPWAAVVFAAFACACAASRVSLRAIVRWRRAVAVLGAFAAAVRRVVVRRAVLRRFAGLRAVVLVVVVVVSAIAGISPLVLARSKVVVQGSRNGRTHRTLVCKPLLRAGYTPYTTLCDGVVRTL
jgi:hypothetical protein